MYFNNQQWSYLQPYLNVSFLSLFKIIFVFFFTKYIKTLAMSKIENDKNKYEKNFNHTPLNWIGNLVWIDSITKLVYKIFSQRLEF